MDEEKSRFESIFGGTPVAAAAAALAAANPETLATMPMLYALLPVLANSLARGRAEKRLSEWLADVDARLRLIGDQLNRFSDAQYRLTVGIVQTAFETIDEEKLRMLKAAVLNVAESDYLEHFEAQLFSRLLRDISATEVAFLSKYRQARGFTFRVQKENEAEKLVAFPKDSSEENILRGLVNLGLLARSRDEGTFSDIGAYLVAPFVPKILDLIMGKSAEPQFRPKRTGA